MCCPPICGKRKQEEKKKEVKKVERDENKETLKKLVPQRFWRGEGIWKKEVGKDASTENLGPCHRVEGRIYAKKGKGILIVQGGKGGGASICRRPAKERIHLTFQVTPNITSTLRSKERWHMENGTELLTHKSVDDKE